MFEGIFEYLRKNHFAMMTICCVLPVILIFGLQLAGITGWWLYPLALVICVGAHAAMMFLGREKKCH